jgi:type I restriction enzyme S subunit
MTTHRATRWRHVAFGELVAHSAFGPRFAGAAYADDGNIATLRTTDLDDDGRISYKSMPLAQLDEVRLGDHLLLRGDLVITRSGTCGIAAVFEGFLLPVLPGAFLIRFRMNDRAESRFYRYYFNSPAGRSNILSVARGAVQQNLNTTSVRALRVPLPPISEQQQIVRVLSTYDDLMQNNQRRLALLDDAARQLYREWFVRLRFPGHEHTVITNGVPNGWETGTIADFFDTASGGTPSRANPDFYAGDINWVKTQEMNDDFIFHTEERITEEALSKSSAKLFPANTVLASMYGGTNIGRTAILGEPAATNQACCALLPKDPRAHFIYAALHFRERRAGLIALAQGAAQTNISQQVIRGLPIVLPSAVLMNSFVESLAPMFDQMKILQRQQARLRAARDLLLPRLMSGEIAV